MLVQTPWPERFKRTEFSAFPCVGQYDLNVSLRRFSNGFMNSQHLPKNMRVRGLKAVHTLFDLGESFFIHPFRVVYVYRGGESLQPVRLLVSVSRRNFRRAVDRNVLKRRIKEGWRKNIGPETEKLKNMDVGLIYVSKKIEQNSSIEDKIIQIIERLNHLNEGSQ